MAIWYFLIVVTNTEWGYVAWGVGGLAGWCAKTIGKGESAAMGLAAAIAALVAIVGGEYLATRHLMNVEIDKALKEAYQEHVTYAKEAVQAKTDDQIKAFLAKQDGLGDGAQASIGPEDIKDFKKELPELQKAANGQLSRTEYEKESRKIYEAIFSFTFVLKQSVSLFTLLWIFLGVGTAYKLAGP